MSNQDIIITVDSFTCPACASVVSFDFDDTITCPGCENMWVFVGDGSISEVKEIYESNCGSAFGVHFVEGSMPEDVEVLRSKMKAARKVSFC